MVRMHASQEATRSLLLDHLETIERHQDFKQPTADDINTYAQFSRGVLEKPDSPYEADRGKREISGILDMNISEFEALIVGKSVLDIGCGTGRFVGEISRLKRTEITALDNDPDMLDKVPERSNIRKVEGDAYDLEAALGDEQFDVVVTCYSGSYWAKTPEQRQRALEGAVGRCSATGTGLIIPIVTAIEQRIELQEKYDIGWLLATAANEPDRIALAVQDWMDAATLNYFFGLEAEGAAECTFVAARQNNLPGIRQEHYSAIVRRTGR